MTYPIPYGKKVLVKRDKKEEKSKLIIITSNELINKGEIVSLPSEELGLKVGDIISFEYSIPSKYTSDDGFEYILVPDSAILMVYTNDLL